MDPRYEEEEEEDDVLPNASAATATRDAAGAPAAAELPVFGVPPPRPDAKWTRDNPAPAGLLFSDERVEYVVETEKYTYEDDDDVTYEWDETARAWFPSFDESAMVAQQSAYGGAGPEDGGQEAWQAELLAQQAPPPKRGKRKAGLEANYTGAEVDPSTEAPAPKKQKNNDKPRVNTSVYVSGLPPDVTVGELNEFFSRCGIIMEDLVGGGPRIKIYKSPDGQVKGDALVTYFKPESVDLAIQLLDESDLRPGKGPLIHVSKAEFQEKEKPEQGNKGPGGGGGGGDRKKAAKKLQKLDKQLGWFEDSGPSKGEKFQRIVIIKNVFTREELEADPVLMLDLKDDMRSECEKLGEVTNVILYDQHPEGVVSIRFRDPEPAAACVRLMNGRFFGGRRLVAEVYDGKTRYDAYKSGKGQETEEEEKARLDRYAKWLEGGLEDDRPTGKGAAAASAPATVSVPSKPPPAGLARDPTKVILDREDEIGEPDPVEVDLTGIRRAGGVADPDEQEDDPLKMPAGAIMLPGGGWALPPRLADEEEAPARPTAPGMAWAGEDEENEALENADEDDV